MSTVITVSGKAEHGKDSFARMAKELLELRGYKVCICHYGDYVKYICKEYLGWNGVKDEAGRTILQYEGTDFVRGQVPDFWVRVIVNFIGVYRERFDYFFVPDARFEDEIDCYNSKYLLRCIAVRVKRLNFENSLTPEQRLHPSETALDKFPFDVEIVADNGLENLRAEAYKFVEELLA